MIQEKVKIVVTIGMINSTEKLATVTTITSDGSYQNVDDEVRDLVYTDFSKYPADSISNISWNYV
jgi:hypothetical protein